GHLARTKSVEADLVLQVHQTCIGLGVQIGCGNADLEFVLEPLRKGFGDLHGVQSSSAFVRPCSQDGSLMLPARSETPCVGRDFEPDPKTGRPLMIPGANAKRRLVRAEGLEPPQLSSLEPKSSASTRSATPA